MLKMMGIFPHPPVIIPEIGRNEWTKVKKTYDAMEKLAQDFAKAGIRRFVVLSPHGPAFQSTLLINSEEILRGDLKNYDFHKEYEFQNMKTIIEKIIRHRKNPGNLFVLSGNLGFRDYMVKKTLDHGVLVPLYFLEKEIDDIELVSISTGFLSEEEMLLAGEIIAEVLDEQEEDYGVVISGDLSHRLSHESYYGFAEEGIVFDRKIAEAFEKEELEKIAEIDEIIVEEAGQCGYIPLVIASGMLQGRAYQSEVINYEHPFGIGYLVGKIKVTGKEETRIDHTKLAREAIQEYLQSGKRLEIDNELRKAFPEKKGVFVSLKKNGKLRGCIGTIHGTHFLPDEIVCNAIAAATEDPRFLPVEAEELEDIKISVDVLEDEGEVKDLSELDPKVYGVIVEEGYLKGLLLPDIEGVDTAEEQIAIAKNKAGIRGDNFRLKKFKVTRYQ